MSQILFADFLNELAGIAGIEVDDTIKATLAKKEFAAILPDDFAIKLKEGIIGKGNAGNLPDVRKKIKGETLGLAETRLKQVLKNELGITDEEYGTLRGDSKNLEIIDRFSDVLKFVQQKGKMEGEKLSGMSADEIRKKVEEEVGAKFQDKIKTHVNTIGSLQSQIEAFGKEKESLVSQFEAKMHRKDIDRVLSQKLSGLAFNPALGSLTGKIKADVASQIAESYAWNFEGDTLLPYSKDDPAAAAMKGAKRLTLDDIITDMTAEYIVKNPNGNNAGNGGRRTPQPPANDGAGAGQKPVRRNPFGI